MAILYLFRICVSKVRFSSRYAPKYLIMFTLGISQSLTEILCIVHFTSCCLDPKSIVSFILSLFLSIQVLTCLNEFFQNFVSDSLFLSLPRKAWSSAYPCKSTLSATCTHFFIVEAYTECRVGPRRATLPCGTENVSFLADE